MEPKVMEPYEPIGDNIPRKVAINRKQKEYASFSLENLLHSEDIDLNTPNFQVEWLSLELFDDNSTDDFSAEEWIARRIDEDHKPRKLYARCLHKEKDGFFNWIRVEVLDYENEIFKCQAEDNRELYLHRLYICFEAEDPRKFVKRLGTAIKNRIYADSLIRYNHYIDNMPTQDLSDLDTE